MNAAYNTMQIGRKFKRVPNCFFFMSPLLVNYSIALFTMRMPLPPPPALALMSTG